MFRTCHLLIRALFLLLVLTPVGWGAELIEVPEPVEDLYIVVFDDEAVPQSNVATVAVELNGRARGRVLATFKHGVRGFGLHAKRANINGLLNDPRVTRVEQAAKVHFSSTDTFPVGDYWHLDRIDQTAPVGSAWWSDGSYTHWSSGTNVDVYVLDTGIQSQHLEFTPGQVTPGANYAGLDIVNPPTQYVATNPCGGWVDHVWGGHGTAVASIIGGQYTGVAKGVKLVPVKSAGCNPAEPWLNDTNTVGVMWAIDWILEQATTARDALPSRRSVVNMSWFYEAGSQCYKANTGTWFDCVGALEANILKLLQADVVVVASANNQNGNHCTTQSPARMGYGGMYSQSSPTQALVITVGGTDINDQRFQIPGSSFNPGSNFGECVSIYAPAHQIHSAHIANASAYRDDPAFAGSWTVEEISTGTSFAAPVVSGIAARLLQRYPEMTVRGVWDYISGTAMSLPGNFDSDGIPENDRIVYISGSE